MDSSLKCCGADEDAQGEHSGTAGWRPTHESQNTQPLGLQFRALLTEGGDEVRLSIGKRLIDSVRPSCGGEVGLKACVRENLWPAPPLTHKGSSDGVP